MKFYKLQFHTVLGLIDYKTKANNLQDAVQSYADEFVLWDHCAEDETELTLEVSGQYVTRNNHVSFSPVEITVTRPSDD